MFLALRLLCLLVCCPLLGIASTLDTPEPSLAESKSESESFSQQVNQHRDKIMQRSEAKAVFDSGDLPDDNQHAPKTSELSSVQPLEGGFYQKLARQKTEHWHRQAQLYATAGNTEAAEEYYFKVLNYGEISEEDRKSIFFEMIDLYTKQKNDIKCIAIYESYLGLYPQDEDVPMIHVAVGDLYRELGSFHLAQEHYYRVINLALNISDSKIDDYRKHSIIAKIRIAETSLMLGNYEDAANKYTDLKKLDYLPPREHASVMFQIGLLQHKMGNDPKAIALLNEFIETYPRDSRVPEAHFLIAESYRTLNQSEKSVQEIFKLLNKSHKLARIDQEVWIFWKKRAGNQIANAFYKEGDFHNALRLYQRITSLDNSPDWQWEVVYQIGLCFERLGLYEKAKDAYSWILNGDIEGEPVPEKEVSERSKELQAMAQWRLQQMIAMNAQMGIVASILSK
jgi:tetratricopeptide (TPR) repeat protein